MIIVVQANFYKGFSNFATQHESTRIITTRQPPFAKSQLNMSTAKKQSPIDIDFVLRRVFGKSAFRPYQRDIIRAALERHHVFVQAATSFGKSLCFQLPAVIDHGITVVVSPLLALMNNQVNALRAADIAVATINSNTPFADRKAILDDLSCGHPRNRLLYVTPEFCERLYCTFVTIHLTDQNVNMPQRVLSPPSKDSLRPRRIRSHCH